MDSKLTGTAVPASSDDVVKTIQALIIAGYYGEDLLNKINSIFGSGGSVSNDKVLRVSPSDVPYELDYSLNLDYPIVYPSDNVKIGDIVIGANGCVGEIVDFHISESLKDSYITVKGLGFVIDTYNPPVEMV